MLRVEEEREFYSVVADLPGVKKQDKQGIL